MWVVFGNVSVSGKRHLLMAHGSLDEQVHNIDRYPLRNVPSMKQTEKLGLENWNGMATLIDERGRVEGLISIYIYIYRSHMEAVIILRTDAWPELSLAAVGPDGHVYCILQIITSRPC
jgi:hypothetical protein